MEKNAKIYIAGHRGLVGSALVRNLEKKGYNNLVYRTSKELDLTDANAVSSFFKKEKPDFVFLAAAKVGGIMANNIYRAQFLYENLQIQNNVIHHSYLNDVQKLMFLGSSCIYPKNALQPLKEEYLLTDTLEYTNEPYAIAKISGIKMAESYNLQYGTNYISVMPTNLYGPNDNYDLEKSHVLPALIRKMHLGKCILKNDWDAIQADMNRLPIENVNGHYSRDEILSILAKYGVSYNNGRVTVELWGSGRPRREFLHSDDMADACVYLLEHIDFHDIVGQPKEKVVSTNRDIEVRNTHINIGMGADLTIQELAEMVKSVTGFGGELHWNTDKPDGTMRKLMDVNKLNELGWKANIMLKEGIEMVYHQYNG
ncbi:MAG: NAD-dependent epimerase/dehydratase family protein [Bacteroidetes bacterium]|jgi:GDP-L-fucose synthase|nr:NAD-dependent epimerase/dehydratase family protein [Bacteroidota bacterium]